MNQQVLRGKTAVITGAAGGIGRAIAELFATNGARIALIDFSAQQLKETVRLCEEQKAFTRSFTVDVTDSDSVRETIEKISEEFDGFDIVVNAAGILDETPFLEMSEATFDRTINVDLKGVYVVSRWAAPIMVAKGGGRIINIASQIGQKGGVGLTHYAAAKAGVIGFTKALALELAKHNILVNAIAPGPIHTPLIAGLSAEWIAAKQAELPVGRFGYPNEVAPTALLLASDPAGNLYTGQTLGPNSGDVMP